MSFTHTKTPLKNLLSIHYSYKPRRDGANKEKSHRDEANWSGCDVVREELGPSGRLPTTDTRLTQKQKKLKLPEVSVWDTSQPVLCFAWHAISLLLACPRGGFELRTLYCKYSKPVLKLPEVSIWGTSQPVACSAENYNQSTPGLPARKVWTLYSGGCKTCAEAAKSICLRYFAASGLCWSCPKYLFEVLRNQLRVLLKKYTIPPLGRLLDRSELFALEVKKMYCTYILLDPQRWAKHAKTL